MNVSPLITIRYNGTDFECDTFQVGFRSNFLKRQILSSALPIVEIKGIWEPAYIGEFLTFCQTGNTDFLTATNALNFRAIAAFFESDELLKATQSFYDTITPHNELRELLLCIENNNNPTSYEDSVGFHLSDIIADELLLKVPITSLFRIFSSKHENEPNPESVAKFVLKLIGKYGRCSSSFLQFIHIPALPSSLIIEFREVYKTFKIGSVEDCELILKLRQDIEAKEIQINELNSLITENEEKITERGSIIIQKDETISNLQNEIRIYQENTKPQRDLLSLYLKNIPIIPDIPFSFVFTHDGIEKAMAVTNVKHYGVGWALTVMDYNPKDINQQFSFHQNKKNIIESLGHPGQMLDDNYGASYSDGTILYVHPPNGFSNQQWLYIENRIVTQRTKNVVTFINGQNPHPLRLYPVDDEKVQKFYIRYTDIETS